MGGFQMELKGLKEIDEKLSGLKGPVARRLIHDAVMAGGKVLQDEVRLRAPARPSLPRGTAIPPGALKSDIELRFGMSEEGLPAAIIKPGRYTAHVARWLEYGHRLVRGGYSKLLSGGRTRGRGQEVGVVRPYPFIRPAFETARIAAMTATVQSLETNLPDAIRTGSLPGTIADGGAASTAMTFEGEGTNG
jgi:hypothetical protein